MPILKKPIPNAQEAWKSYKSFILFKKPNMYRTSLKNFCPIALSKASYKLLTSALAKRKSLWLERNKGIAFVQSAIFCLEGVIENTLFVSETKRLKKAVIYLDITDVFKIGDHNLIITSLEQCCCPKWITRLIRSLYKLCTTTPVNTEGEELCDPTYVDCSVRQGCPLIGILLKLVIDHLIRTELTPVSCSLG